jgi:hypothetical protein
LTTKLQPRLARERKWASASRASGGIVGADGKAVFAANLVEGEDLMDDNLELTKTLEDAQAAEIWFIVRYHGPVDPDHIYEADKQVSIHLAP